MFRENAEQPEIERKKEISLDYIKKAFVELAPNFNLEKNPHILERLLATGEHFRDAVEIAKIIYRLWDENENKDDLILASLVHDIGKSGPLDTNQETTEIIQKLFVHKKSKNNPNLPIAEFLEKEGYEDKDEIIDTLEKNLGIKTQEESMINFWRRHVDWTWEILSEKNSGVSNEVATIAGSHHILDGKNPVNLELNNIPDEATFLEITDKYTLLTLIDKYQAFIERSGVTHEKAIELIGGMIEKCQNISDQAKNKYRQMLKKIETQAKNLPEVKIAA